MIESAAILTAKEAEEAYAKVIEFQCAISKVFWDMYLDDRYSHLLKSVDEILDKLTDIEKEILDQSEDDPED